MIPISSALSGGLVWSKAPHKRGYELNRNGAVVGSLQRISFWSTEFQAESHAGSWRFRRVGFWRIGTEIVDSNSNASVATFRPSWSGGGTLCFSDGQAFRITSIGCWRPVWMVLAENGQPVLSIRSREKAVELPKESYVSEGRLILLAIFTWHAIQQAAQDAASVAAMVAATS
jgi:hypothetical protein